MGLNRTITSKTSKKHTQQQQKQQQKLSFFFFTALLLLCLLFSFSFSRSFIFRFCFWSNNKRVDQNANKYYYSTIQAGLHGLRGVQPRAGAHYFHRTCAIYDVGRWQLSFPRLFVSHRHGQLVRLCHTQVGRVHAGLLAQHSAHKHFPRRPHARHLEH